MTSFKKETQNRHLHNSKRSCFNFVGLWAVQQQQVLFGPLIGERTKIDHKQKFKKKIDPIWAQDFP